MESIPILKEIVSDTDQGKFRKNSKQRIVGEKTSGAPYNKTEQLGRANDKTNIVQDRLAVFIEQT